MTNDIFEKYRFRGTKDELLFVIDFIYKENKLIESEFAKLKKKFEWFFVENENRLNNNKDKLSKLEEIQDNQNFTLDVMKDFDFLDDNLTDDKLENHIETSGNIIRKYHELLKSMPLRDVEKLQKERIEIDLDCVDFTLKLERKAKKIVEEIMGDKPKGYELGLAILQEQLHDNSFIVE